MGTPAARGGLSLYADLLDNADSSASGQPAAQEDTKNEAQPAKPFAPALRFQPIRRPQVKQSNKSKPTLPKAFTTAATTIATATTTEATTTASATAAPPAAAPQRSTLADWTAANDDDEYLYGSGGGGGGQYRERGGRRKKKKKDNQPEATNWDEIYDPARPTNVEEYLQSDERYREIMEWKDVLYAHRRNKARRSRSYSDYSRSDSGDMEEDRRPAGDFAPPANLSFAPPPVSPPRASAPPAAVLNDATGDDAYNRRLALSGMGGVPPPPPPPPPEPDHHEAAPPIPPPSPTPEAGVISRAPVRYEPPQPEEMDMDMDMDDDSNNSDYNYIPPPIGSTTTTTDQEAPSTADQDLPRSSRPGQAAFAERLMSKYGWTKGSGLGASESGITSALRVQVEKRRKRPDAEGGGYAEPGGRGKIIGGKSAPKKDGGSGSKFGKMSEVIVLDHMLDNMSETDLAADLESGELKQDIGQECGEKYGTIERISVDVLGRRVFIKFTNQVSALRAVNDLEGRNFNGNALAVKFYDLDEFEKGVYR